MSTLLAARAHAHELEPAPTRIAFDPDDPSRIVLSAAFGLVVSSDAGARWSCAAAAGGDPTRPAPPVAVLSDALVLGSFAGVSRADAALCDFARLESSAVRDAFVPDLVRDPSDARTVWAIASTGFGADRLVRSVDGGARFEAVGEPFEAVLLERVLVAPSDPSRVYLSGYRPPSGGAARRGFVWASEDRGARFAAYELPLLEGERAPLLVGVDPARPERLFVRVPRGELDERPERLLESLDGGRSFRQRFALARLTAFAVSEDGGTLWVGSLGEGLWRAEGEDPFGRIAAREVRCAAVHGGALWLCLDPRPDGVILARSADGGATLEPRVRIDRLDGLVDCPRCSSVRVACPAWEADLESDVRGYLRGEAPTPARPFVDAGLPVECRPGAGGCAVDATGGSSRGTLVLVLAVLWLVRGCRWEGRAPPPAGG